MPIISLLLTLVALYLGFKNRGSGFKTALYICIFNAIVFLYIFIDYSTCVGAWCGLGSVLFGSLITMLTGAVSIFFASKGKLSDGVSAVSSPASGVIITDSVQAQNTTTYETVVSSELINQSIGKSSRHYLLLAILTLSVSFALGYFLTGHPFRVAPVGFGLNIVAFAVLLSQSFLRSNIKHKAYLKPLSFIFGLMPFVITAINNQWMYIFSMAPGFWLAAAIFAVAADDKSIFPRSDRKTYRLVSFLLVAYIIELFLYT